MNQKKMMDQNLSQENKIILDQDGYENLRDMLCGRYDDYILARSIIEKLDDSYPTRQYYFNLKSITIQNSYLYDQRAMENQQQYYYKRILARE